MPTKTVTEISLISNITGVVKIKNADGTFRELHAGDTIQPGAVLVFDDGAQLTLKDVNTSQTQVIAADQLPDDPSVVAVTPPGNDVDIAQYQKAILSGEDPTKLFEAAAAGGTIDAGSGVGSGNEGFVSVTRTSSVTIAEAGFDTTGTVSSISDASLASPNAPLQTAPNAPGVIILTDVDGNGYINASEQGNSDLTSIRITLPANAIIGDVLTISDGSSTQTYVLTADDLISGHYDTSVSKPSEGSTLTVTATLSDTAGNTSPNGSASAILDTTVAAPSVVLTTDSGSSASDHYTNSGALTIGNLESGASVQYSTDGGQTWTNSFSAVEGDNTVAVRQVDVAGNISAATTLNFTLDTMITAPTITFESTGSDGIYNAAEVAKGAANTITATIHLPTDFAATDSLSINGVAYSVSAAELTAGAVNVEVAPGASVTAQITDAAGNVSTLADQTAPVADLSAQAPTITFESTGSDGIYNAAEVAQGAAGTITATIHLPTDFTATDSLSINGVAYSVSAAELTAGAVNVEVAPGASVTAQITDAAGNVSTLADQTAPVADLSAQAPTITFESTGSDGIYNAAEVAQGAAGTITATIHLPTDFTATDSLSINGVAYSVSAAELTAGAVNVEVAPGASVTAQITDAAGNVSTLADQTAPVADLSAQAPTITFESTGSDGIYNAAEVAKGAANTITATIHLPTDFAATDSLSINGVAYSVSAAELTAGAVNVEVAPGASVTAQITDAAGNVSTLADQTAPVAD
ncbi:retention module-containing protein, partial [uncultured Tolumonas sp.]|uniref:retention module-containing protein n=1 Tax=uncultured Tolumonas sp. TaxID=263765 RepID=UPI002A0A8BE2